MQFIPIAWLDPGLSLDLFGGADADDTQRCRVSQVIVSMTNGAGAAIFCIAVIQEGDTISFDIPNRKIQLEVDEEELQRRLSQWTPPEPKHTTGALAKYARLVSSAARGAVCS